MKILVLADTHVPFTAKDLPKVIYEEADDVDLILHAGDIVEYGVIERLEEFAEVKAVCGNMDDLVSRQALPKKEIITAGRFKIGLTHGEGAPDKIEDYCLKAFSKNKVDAIVFGHSHLPMNKFIDGILLFNPGSPTDKVFAPYNSYGILNINDKITAEIKRIE